MKRLIGIAALAATGCGSAPAQQPEVQKWEVDSLRQDLERVQRSVEMIQQSDNPEPFKLGDNGFGYIETRAGPATVEWLRATPSGNGVKAALRFGNLSNADWNRYRILGAYGKLTKDGEPDKSDHHLFDVTLSTPLKAGRWTTVSAQINGPAVDDVGYIDILNVSVENVGLAPEPS